MHHVHALKYIYLLKQLRFNPFVYFNHLIEGYMKIEMTRKNRMNRERVKMLIEELASNRRQWIIEVHPSITEVQEEFPALMDHMMVNLA